jgi:hypothetical protein
LQERDESAKEKRIWKSWKLNWESFINNLKKYEKNKTKKD